MAVLIAGIVRGEHMPGEMLPGEAAVARAFGISRGVARECIRGLEERGLVVVKHGRGATVNDDAHWDVLSPDVLSALLESHRGVEVLNDYLECRRILEIEAAELAARRVTSEGLAALTGALERMTTSAARTHLNAAAEDVFHAADIDFHRAVIAATGNRALARMTEPTHRALAQARGPLARPQFRFEQSIPEHERILRAIADRDPTGARDAMRAHLLTVEHYLREYARSTVEPTAEAHGAVPTI
jgi:DNA-binding FadR family transcriptional regulator